MAEQPSATEYPAVFVTVSPCGLDGYEQSALSWRCLSVPDLCRARAHGQDQMAFRVIEKMRLPGSCAELGGVTRGIAMEKVPIP